MFGALFAALVPELLLSDYSGLSVYAVCGMVAVISPVIGAPMTALLLVFELTRSYEITIAAMVAIVFANLVAYRWYGRSLYDHQLAERGIDLSQGRERAYLQHHKVVEHVTQALPVTPRDATLEQLQRQMNDMAAGTAVVVDQDLKFVGIVFSYQLEDRDRSDTVASLDLHAVRTFDQHTSIWDAMQIMRSYVGDAIAVVDCDNGHYLGAIPEAIVINAYLDAAAELRREEHEA